MSPEDPLFTEEELRDISSAARAELAWHQRTAERRRRALERRAVQEGWSEKRRHEAGLA